MTKREDLMPEGSRLFVYGTLRQGQGADLSRTQGVSYVGTDFISGGIYGGRGWFPRAKDIPERFDPKSKTKIFGEVFRINNPNVTVMLDNYEGHPSLFLRKITTTSTGDRVYVYEYNHEVHPDELIADGDWVKLQGDK